MRTFYLVANILVVLSAASVDAGPAMRNKRLATCQKKSIVLNKKLAGLKQNIRDALADAFGCSAGMFSANNDDACADWTTADADSCGDGHFWTAGSATSDSSCVECTTGTFSASKNAVCEDWKNVDAASCGAGYFWTAGSTTSDSSCVGCTAGTFSASNNAACADWAYPDAASCGAGFDWTTGSTTADSTCAEGKMELRWYQTNDGDPGNLIPERIGYTPKNYASAASFCQGKAVGARMATLLEYCGFDGENTGKVAGRTVVAMGSQYTGFSGGQQQCESGQLDHSDPDDQPAYPYPAYPFDVAQARIYQSGGCNQWAPFGEDGDYVQIGGGSKGRISPCTLASEHFGEGWAQQVNSFEFDAQRLVLCAEPMPKAVEATSGCQNGVVFGNPWNGAPSITIPAGETEVKTAAFQGCMRLSDVTIPNTVTHILDNAFANTGLKTITIPSSVVSIGNYVFYTCNALLSITIPSSVTSMGNYVFHTARALTSAIFLNSPATIPEGTFADNFALESFTIPASVTEIGEWAFYDNKKLTQLTIPDGVTTIGDSAFRGGSCTKANGCGLTSLVIPPSVTSIGDYTFYQTPDMKNVTISSSSAWADCSSAKRSTFGWDATKNECKFEAHVTVIKV